MCTARRKSSKALVREGFRSSWAPRARPLTCPRKLLPTYRGLAAPGVRRRSLRHNGKSLKFPRSRVSGDALRRLPVEAARSAHPLRASAQAPLRNPPVVRARAQRLSWLRILSIAPRPLTAQPSTSTAHPLRTRFTVLLRTAVTCCGRLPQPWSDLVVGLAPPLRAAGARCAGCLRGRRLAPCDRGGGVLDGVPDR